MALISTVDVHSRWRSDPRTAHRALRAEKAQLNRWRRLLRARLDLAVAAFAPPDTLGEMSWDLLPDAQLTLPRRQELTDAIALATPEDQVALMERLRSLDKVLAAYGVELETALEDTADAVVGDLAQETRRSEDGASGAR